MIQDLPDIILALFLFMMVGAIAMKALDKQKKNKNK